MLCVKITAKVLTCWEATPRSIAALLHEERRGEEESQDARTASHVTTGVSLKEEKSARSRARKSPSSFQGGVIPRFRCL